MRKVIDLGKIDYDNSGRKNCRVTVELELCTTDDGPEFTCCGNIWNPKETDIYCGGQCLDTIAEYIGDDPLFKIIYRLHGAHHMNATNAGTEAQEAALKKYRETQPKGHHTTFDEDCEYLKSIGLYEDNGYRYGSSWLYREIPEEDLMLIERLIR